MSPSTARRLRVFDGMFILSDIGQLLRLLPRSDDGNNARAGAPFELPTRWRFPISRPIIGRSRRPPGPRPTAEVSRSASIDVPVAPRLGATAVTFDAAMSTNRDDLLDLSGLAASDQRGELVAVGAVAFGARPVEVALHGAHRHR